MNWATVDLGDVVSFLGGGTPSKKNPEYWGGDIPWATVKDIKSPSIDRTIDSITEEGLRNSSARLVPSGTVILPTRMALGKAAITTLPLAINQDLKAAIPKSSLDPRYLFHFLQSVSNEIQKLGAGATVQGVTLEKLARLKIPLPPLDEQKRIAAVLDKADALFRKFQDSLVLTETFLHSVFLDMFGSEKEPRCQRVRLSDHLEFITSGGRGWAKYYSTTGTMFIRSLDVQMNEINDAQMILVQPPNNAEANRARVRRGDVLLTITGSLIGRVAPVTEAYAGAFVSQHVAILRTSSFQPEFLSWAISTQEGQRQIRKNQTGQTKPGLNFEQIGRLTIPLPSKELEEKFFKLVKQRGNIKNQQRIAFDSAKTLFASLQQYAFRGELDLSRLIIESSNDLRLRRTPEKPSLKVTKKEKSTFFLSAPKAFEIAFKKLDAAVKKGELIRWSADYFKYRILGVRTTSFSFSDIMQTAESIFDEPPPYEEIKDIILDLLGLNGGPALLNQRFDLHIDAITKEISGRKEILFEPKP